MSWMQRLTEVYDNNVDQVGKFETRYGREFTLVPVCHVVENAGFEVILNQDGTFHRAKVIPKEEQFTITPSTLSSSNRTSGIAPHYIHDKLYYVAKDYRKFGKNRKRDKYFDVYEMQMVEWSMQDKVPNKVKIITSYIQKGTLIQDLINHKVINLDNKGEINEKVFNDIVRFDVLNSSPDTPPLWQDYDVFENFTSYIKNTMLKNLTLGTADDYELGICYASGENDLIISNRNHGKKIIKSHQRAKIISSNDDKNFTFRGRFKESKEAVQIGYEASQKSHQAIRWLIQRQGINVDTRYFITFGNVVPKTLNAFASTFDLLGIDPEVVEPITEEIAAKEINKAFFGLANNIEGFYDNKLITMAFDAATTGRLAIVYYQELEPKIFLDALSHWHSSCRWMLFYRGDDKKIKKYVGTPSTFDMAKATYGEKTNPAVKKEFYTRILPSIIERRPIPKDIIYSIYHRVIRPESFKEKNESATEVYRRWEKSLNVACAMISYNHKKEVPDMSLQKENINRDYLFGRLLGVAEVMERRVLERRNESRATNAMRYFNAFAQRPARTWSIIRKQIQPYVVREGKNAGYYKRIIEEIEAALGPENMTDDALKPIFLTGYSSQVQDLYKKKEEKDEKDDITK